LFDVRDQLGAVDRQGLSIQQIIRESQSTVIEQQTTMTATVRETMAQIEDETRSILDAVHATLLGPTTQGDQMIRMLNQLLEQLPRLSAGHSVDARVIEVQEDMKSIDETPSEEILPHAELAESVELILGAIHDKKGVFGLNEAEDVIDSLLGLLKTMVSDRFLESAAESVLTYRRWCQTCTKRDLATLRRNLMAVQGIILSAGRVSVNEASKNPSDDDDDPSKIS
jgi:hypothetical protein